MDRLLEVREFDSIIEDQEQDLALDDSYHRLHSREFQELVDFFYGYKSDAVNADIIDFMRFESRRNCKKLISIRNYVGLIQLRSGYQIQILPKISLAEGNDVGNIRTKKIFLKMLKSLNDFPGKLFDDSNLNVDHMNLYEVFISIYLQAVKELIKRGIKSDYVNREENSHYFRGKLLLSQNIRRNFAHNERFYMMFDEFLPDCPENRIIKSALLKLVRLTHSSENSKRIRQLLCAFEMVGLSLNYKMEFAKSSINRISKHYDMLIKWSRVFLSNKGFTTFSGRDSSKALLFPMERVYECYIAKKVKKIFGSAEWNIYAQDKGHYLFEEPRSIFSLRPDLVLKNDNRTVIMDTKWKNLIASERKNYGISQADMYQMYAYSKKYNTSEVWLLYPLNNEMRGYDDIFFKSGDGTCVRIYFVDIENAKESLDKLREIIG